jgi:DNA-binding NarL/FixJ family response regulator
MPAQKAIRVLIISAIRLYRDGLAQVLGRDGRVEVVGAFDAVEHSIQHRLDDADQPDVVLLDTMVPDALKDMRLVSAEFPGAKVVALGVARDDGDVIACAEAGIAGYVFRDASIEELFATLESSARGELRCSPEMAATLLRRVANLARYGGRDGAPNITRREREILELIDRGCSNKQIAAQLFIEVATVKNHIHNILEKLDVHTRAEAAAKMRRAHSDRSSGRIAGVDWSASRTT